jgi:hypothetical protein
MEVVTGGAYLAAQWRRKGWRTDQGVRVREVGLWGDILAAMDKRVAELQWLKVPEGAEGAWHQAGLRVRGQLGLLGGRGAAPATPPPPREEGQDFETPPPRRRRTELREGGLGGPNQGQMEAQGVERLLGGTQEGQQATPLPDIDPFEATPETDPEGGSPPAPAPAQGRGRPRQAQAQAPRRRGLAREFDLAASSREQFGGERARGAILMGLSVVQLPRPKAQEEAQGSREGVG